MVWSILGNRAGNERAPNTVRRERGGIVAQPPARPTGGSGRHRRSRTAPARRTSPACPPPMPGRSLVTRRAIRDLVRTADPVHLRRDRASPAAARSGALLERLGHRPPRAPPRGRRGADGRPRPHGRLRAARSPRSRARSRRRSATRCATRSAASRTGSRSGSASCVHEHGHRARSRPPRDQPRAAARRTSPAAGRTSPDGPSVLRRRGLPGRVPERRREPRGERRRDQRAQRVPGPGRRHRHEHAGHGPGGARGGRQGRARTPTSSGWRRPRASAR